LVHVGKNLGGRSLLVDIRSSFERIILHSSSCPCEVATDDVYDPTTTDQKECRRFLKMNLHIWI
jgi:hypothetical protein